MKTAVIISGQARTFARCLPSLWWQVFSKLKNPVFFASGADDEDAASIEALRTFRCEPGVERIIYFEKVSPPELPEPPAEYTLHAPYAITPTRTDGVSAIQGILRQLWHLSRAYKFAMANGAADCDLVVRCRPDVMFHRMGSETFPSRRLTEANEARVPWWGHYGPGCNDRFGVMGKIAAKAYFETYDVLPELLAAGVPFHPETLIGAAVERAGCVINRTLDAEFAMIRKNGEWVHMQALAGEMCAWTAYLSQR